MEAGPSFSLSAEQMIFASICQQMIDFWIEAHNPQPFDVYGRVLNRLNGRVGIALVNICAQQSDDWFLQTIRPSKIAGPHLNLHQIFADGRLGDFSDQAYLRDTILPQYRAAREKRKPVIDTVDARLNGVKLIYDRLILPQKAVASPSWLIVCTYMRFIARTSAHAIKLDRINESILQYLMEGQTTKEIATRLQLSPRTIEHRLDNMRRKLGAKNLAQLASIIVVEGVDRRIVYKP